MPKIFEKVGMRRPRYTGMELSHEKKLSLNMGELIPVYLQEILPGDQFRVSSEVMLRLAPMVAPVMHRVNVYLHYFYVPNRIIWDEWEDFITGGPDGLAAPVFPERALDETIDVPGSLSDYLGIPTVDAAPVNNVTVSQLPFRAYRKIWNEYYRDQTLQTEIDTDFPSSVIYELATRCWEKDYFTSALPFSQRGPEVGVPVDLAYSPGSTVKGILDGEPGEPLVWDVTEGALGTTANPTSTQFARIENLDENQIDVSINQLRTSSRLQRWLETQARGGARYVETLLNHFGVKSSDARLDRPEYLGGGKQPVVISEVLNTSATATDPQGNLAGHGISVGQTNSFKKRFEEHGYVMGILSVMPRTNYQQGIPRHWSRRDKLDYYWPEFANLGEQAIRAQEIFYGSNLSSAAMAADWGYQQRYAEYKYGNSMVHGDFKESLDFWHMGRIFPTPPVLNGSFVESDPTQRIFAVTDPLVDKLYAQVFNNVKARRPMPAHANPNLR